MTAENVSSAQATAQDEIRRLVERYDLLMSSGLTKGYNEARTVNELISPMFESLGWDARNRRTLDEVIPEEAASRGRVDWAFRIGGVPRLFLGVKRSLVQIQSPRPLLQA